MPQASCPRCGKKIQYRRSQDVPSFPFCSERCRLIDLGNWLDERYRISEPLQSSTDKDADEPDADEPEQDGNGKARNTKSR